MKELCYPPDLNTIERFWRELKRKTRSMACRFTSLDEVIDYAFANQIEVYRRFL